MWPELSAHPLRRRSQALDSTTTHDVDRINTTHAAEHPHHRVSRSHAYPLRSSLTHPRRTPGTGKTTHATQLLEALQALPSDGDRSWEHVNVGDFVKDRGCHSGYNEEWQSWDVDEDKVRCFGQAVRVGAD